MLKVMILTTIIVASPLVVSAAIIQVPSDQPNIQAGIDAAVNGDTVLVADGMYTGDGNRDIDFKGKAITVKSENGAETCIIDCQGTERHRGFYFHNNEPENAIVLGFTIFGGTHLFGGAIHCEDSSPTISNCIFKENRAAFWGGGIGIVDSPCVTISNCTFTGNISSNGGGICIEYCPNATIINCTFTGNTAVGGGGIGSLNSDSTISNCTFSMNTATINGGGVYVYNSSSASISNCILWNDTLSEIDFEESNLTITYSLIQGGYPGIGNINADPLFIGSDPFNCHLLPDSPCIDSGTTEGSPTTDMDGNPRPQGGAIDMGAYEYQGWPSVMRAYITMPTHSFVPGNTASCTVSVWNAGTSIMKEYPLFVMLDIFCNCYYAPSFSEFDHYNWTFLPGLTELTVLPEFAWPEGVGSASGIIWYAALVNPEMTELASEVGVFDFGWNE